MLSRKYQNEQIELEQQITNLREELSKMEQDMIGTEKWIELIKEYSVPKELTAPLLNAMIEKIIIHEATTNEENERIQEIEIYYLPIYWKSRLIMRVHIFKMEKVIQIYKHL